MKTRCFLVAALVATFSAQAQPDPSLDRLTVEQLRTLYLDCDRQSSRHVLDLSSAIFCSSAADQLRIRGFDGSFERMLAWWRSVREAERAAVQTARGE
jgi:hypothetical protein